MQDDTSSATHLFAWVGQAQQHNGDSNLYYTAFRLQDQVYNIGDNLCLYPETPQQPAFLGKMLAAFQGPGEVPQVKVQWYERMVTLQPQCKGMAEFERQLVLLEETDVNPLGCIQSKCSVIRARNYEEAAALSSHVVKPEEPWFFCRGVFKSSTNTFEPFQEFTDDALVKTKNSKHDAAEGVADSEEARLAGRQQQQQHLEQGDRGRERDNVTDSIGESAGSKRAKVQASAGQPTCTSTGAPVTAAVDGGLVLLDSLIPGSAFGAAGMFRTDVAAVELPGLDLLGVDSSKGLPGLSQQRISTSGQAGWPEASTKALSSGKGANRGAVAATNAARSCLQCGVTSTPQWREGPLGPKTLCNACGVRWGRAQQKAVKKAGGNPGGRNNRPTASREQAQQNGSSSNLVQFGEAAAGQESSAHLDSDTQPSSDKEQQQAGKGGRRPVRLAAMLAASRTAEYARTGAFPEQGGAGATLPVSGATAVGAPATANGKANQADGSEQVAAVKSSSMLSGFTGAGPAAADLLSCGRQLSVAELTALAEEQLAMLADGNTFSTQQLGANALAGSAAMQPEAGTATAAAAAGSHNESSHHSTDSDVDAGGEHGTPFTIMVTPAATQQGPATRRRGGMAAGPVTTRGGAVGRQGWQAQAASRPMTLPPLDSMTPWTTAEEVPEQHQQQAQFEGMDTMEDVASLVEVSKASMVPPASGMTRAGSAAAKRRSSTANPPVKQAVRQEQGTSGAVAGVAVVAPAQLCTSAPAVAAATAAAVSAEASGSAPATQGSTDLKVVAERAASFVPAIQQYLPVLSRFDSMRDQLPPSVVTSLLEAGASVEKAVNEAAAADAALAAVRQVFLTRSAAADKARQEAVTSVGRMRTFVQQLLQQYPELDISALRGLDGFSLPGGDIKGEGAEQQGMEFDDEVLGLGALGLPPVSLSLGGAADMGCAMPAPGKASRRPSAADGLLMDGEEVGTPAAGSGNSRNAFPGTPGTLINAGPSSNALLGLMDMDDMLLGPGPAMGGDDDLGIMGFGVSHGSDLQAMLA